MENMLVENKNTKRAVVYKDAAVEGLVNERLPVLKPVEIRLRYMVGRTKTEEILLLIEQNRKIIEKQLNNTLSNNKEFMVLCEDYARAECEKDRKKADELHDVWVDMARELAAGGVNKEIVVPYRKGSLVLGGKCV